MNTRDNPLSLRIVAWLFTLAGLLTAVDIVVKLFRGHLDLNLMLLCLWIGPGLLRHSPAWRKWALAFLWFNFFAIFLLAVFALLRPPLNFKVFGFPAAPPPLVLTLLFLLAAFLLALWQYRVLIRPDIHCLFAPVPPPLRPATHLMRNLLGNRLE